MRRSSFPTPTTTDRAAGPPTMPSMVSAPVPVATRELRNAPWVCLGERSSGATVYRVGEGPTWYVKTTPPRHDDDHRFNPVWEADRLRWLAGHGLPVAEVVEIDANDDLAWVVTTALPGRPAGARWPAAERGRVIDVMADAAVALHALPVADCPFERRLADLLNLAEASVKLGAVDLDDVDAAHEGWTAEQLLAELRRMPVPPEDDLVVGHGDLCLGNVLIDPGTLTLTGIIDVDRVGVADRWLDLSLALYNIGEDDTWGFGPAFADRFLRRCGIATVDQHKVTFYQLLDELM